MASTPMPAVAMDHAGDCVVVWAESNGSAYSIYAQRFSASGVAQGGNITVVSGNSTTSADGSPSVAMDSVGDFVIAWEKDFNSNLNSSEQGIFVQRYNASGVAQGSVVRVSSPSTIGGINSEPSVAMDSAGDFVIAWQGWSQDSTYSNLAEVYYQRFAATGAKVGQQQKANSFTQNAGIASLHTAMDATGDFVITWDGQAGAISRTRTDLFNSSGGRVASEINIVGTATTANTYSSSAAMDATGGFVVVWIEDHTSTGGGSPVEAQRYTASGAVQGSPIAVGSSTGTTIGTTSVAMDAAGDFVVGWNRNYSHTYYDDIYAQRFLAAGTSQGGSLLVNFYQTGRQRFPAVASDVTGHFIVTWTSYGQDAGNYGIYAQRYAPAPITNHAPKGTANTLAAFENIPYVFKEADFGFSDPGDTPPNNFQAVKISSLPTAGTLTDNGVTVTVSQFVSVTDINKNLLKFIPATNRFATAYSSFTYQVQDDGGTANGGVNTDPTARAMTINVNHVNQPPVGTSKTVTTTEDHNYVLLAADFGFTDPNDNPSNSLLAVKMTMLPSMGTLTDNGVKITTAGSFISATDIAQNKLVFTPNPGFHGSPYILCKFQVEDNGGTANGGANLDPTPKEMDVNLTFVNHAPVGTSKTVVVEKNTTYTFQMTDFPFADPNDHPGNNFLAVRITALPAHGTLTINGLNVAGGAYIPVIDISQGHLKYTPVANGTGTNFDHFNFELRDDGGTANHGFDTDPIQRSMTFNVLSINHAPVGKSNTVLTLENVAYVFKVADFGFSDPNNSPPNVLMNAIIIVPQDAVGTLTDNGVPISSGTTKSVSAADISAGKLKYTPPTGALGTISTVFLFHLQDNGGTANGGVDTDPALRFMSVYAAFVNHPPLGTSKTVSTPENTPYVFQITDFPFSDPNDNPPNNFLAVRITALPTHGTLTINGLNVATGAYIPVVDISQGHLKYIPQTNGTGTNFDHFNFELRDNGGTANRGFDTDPTQRTITFNVLPVNHPPVGTARTVTTPKNTPYVFALTDFPFDDPDDPVSNNFLAVRITTLPTHGSLTLNGSNVTTGTEVTVLDISLGFLEYTPALNGSGASFDSFTFQLKDDGGTANGGNDTDPIPKKMAISVT